MIYRERDNVIFFFEQKTSYEMRISDWSSDVCSSDLQDGEVLAQVLVDRLGLGRRFDDEEVLGHGRLGLSLSGAWAEWEPRQYIGFAEEDARSLGHGRSGLHLFIVESRRGGGCQVLSVSGRPRRSRSEEHTAELQSLMRTAYAVFCLK